MISSIKNFFKNSRQEIVIIDIGCRWGFADKFLQKNFSFPTRIFGFDPDKKECERLNHIYQEKNITNIKLIPVGLSNIEGKQKLYLTKEEACSSLYKPNEYLTHNYPALSCAKEVSQTEVSVSTINSWVKQEKLDYIDYMKVDTQGAELKILEGSSDILSTVRFLEVEVEFNPIYDEQPIFSEVDLYLRKFGFVLWKFSNFVHYSKDNESKIELINNSVNYDHHKLEFPTRGGQLFWADAFYIQKEIIDTNYTTNNKQQLQRDMELSEALGFLDLKQRLSNKLSEIK
jgi:FkbM family methyltransferase